jgi:hypothetical protein
VGPGGSRWLSNRTVFEDFEFTHLGRAKTAFEYVLVNEATKLTVNIPRQSRGL